VDKRGCSRRRAAVLLYKYGVDPSVIAETLCLRPSTVRRYIYLYLRDVQRGLRAADPTYNNKLRHSSRQSQCYLQALYSRQSLKL